MTMTHNEALREAAGRYWESPIRERKLEDMEASIRAYIEARGLVLVPREPEFDMVWAGLGPERKHVRDTWRKMLAAAPDPFEDGE